MTLLKVNEPEWKQLHRIADGLAPEVSRELFTALDSLKDQIPTATLVDLIEDGRLAEVLAAVKLEMPDLTALRNAIGSIVAESASRATQAFPMAFDLVNERAVKWAAQHSGELIQGVNRETQKAVSEIVQRGFLEGTAPRVQALAIEQVVGLTNRDAGAVSKFLTGLTDSGVSERRAKELANTYSNRLLRRRAQMIARTETMRASNMGQQLAWENATDLGLLLPGEVQKVWIVTDDDRTCARCLGLEDAQVDLDAGFTEVPKEDRPDVPPRPSKDLKPKPRKSDLPKPTRQRTTPDLLNTKAAKDFEPLNAAVGMNRVAEQIGMTSTELEQAIPDKWNPLIKSGQVRVDMGQSELRHVLEDGRLKTQFETNSSLGSMNTSWRNELEHSLFGLPDDINLDPSQRPIYGYLADPNHKGSGTPYGNVTLQLKQGVNQRSTGSFGDTLAMDGAFPSSDTIPQMFNLSDGMDWRSVEWSYLDEGFGVDTDLIQTPQLNRVPGRNKYLETQIWDGVSVDDISEVVFTNENPTTDIKESLNELGIKWRRVNQK